MFCINFILLFREGIGEKGRDGWLGDGYLCEWEVGGGLLTTMAGGLHSREITTLRNNVHDDYTICQNMAHCRLSS